MDSFNSAFSCIDDPDHETYDMFDSDDIEKTKHWLKRSDLDLSREKRMEERWKWDELSKSLPDEEWHRLDTQRRAKLDKKELEQFLETLLQKKVSDRMMVIIGGVAKVLVGELVEKSFEVMKETEYSGPIQPSHLHEAHRRLLLSGSIALGKPPSSMFLSK